MMARSRNALFTGRIQNRKTNPSIAHIRLATHGRSIQLGPLIGANGSGANIAFV
jgi:hypothetical protein